MADIKFDVSGAAASEILDESSPSIGDSVELADGVVLEYQGQPFNKSVEVELASFLIEHAGEFAEFAAYTILLERLRNSGAETVRIEQTTIVLSEVDNEEFEERMRDVVREELEE